MKFKWGTYPFQANAVECSTDVETQRTATGQPYQKKKRFSLRGELLAQGQQAVSDVMLALEAALAVPYQDLILLHDDNSESATVLKNAGSLSGVVCVSGPGYPESHGGEYVNQRTFTAVFEAEYPVGDEDWLLSFTETLRFSGGGYERTAEPAVDGPPVEFVLYGQTPYTATQRGSATGYLSTPIVPAPIWPDKRRRENPELEVVTPQRIGAGAYRSYAISWSYEFVSATPLVGVPNLFP